MPFNIVVPDLGESVVEATVARWLKHEGDPVSVGEAVVVLETEKVDLEVGAEKDGVLSFGPDALAAAAGGATLVRSFKRWLSAKDASPSTIVEVGSVELELVDLVGLDTRLSILKYLHSTLGEKFRPCPLLEEHVRQGRLGRKAGKGVYDY